MSNRVSDVVQGLKIILKYYPEATIEAHDGHVLVKHLSRTLDAMSQQERLVMRSFHWYEDENADAWKTWAAN